MDEDKAPVFQCLQSPAVTRREDVIKRDRCYNLIGLAHERAPARPRSHDPQLMLMCRVFHHTGSVTLHSLHSLNSSTANTGFTGDNFCSLTPLDL